MTRKNKRRGGASGPVQQALSRGLELHRNGQLAEAERIYRDVLAQQPDNPQAAHLLGYLYFHAGNLEQSAQWLRKAVAHKSNFPVAWNDLGNTLRELGAAEEAAKAYLSALKHDADFAPAHCALAQLHDHSLPDQYEAEWVSLGQAYTRSSAHGQARRDLAFGMASACEQRGEFEQAFQLLQEAHHLSQGYDKFDRASAEEYLQSIRSTFDSDFMTSRAGQGNDSELPVFVVGLPRSGSTLVEQILASHSRVHGGGELRLIGNLCGRLEQQSGQPFATAFAELNAANVGSLADVYIRQLSAMAPLANRVVDKMPANFLTLGMLAVLFPRARFIHCRRDPLAVCWSIYSTRFAEPHAFADDLGDLGAYYRAYDQHMHYWKKLLPGRVYDLGYEELLAQPEPTIRSLLKHCGLEFEESCLHFHETERAVRTASALQVRRPLYDSSLTRYQAFEPWLAPLRETLGDFT